MSDCAARITRLEQRLARERQARLQAEAVAEKGLRDLYISQQRAELLQLVALAAVDGSTLPKVLGIALTGLCETIGWPLGHVFLVDGSALTSSGVWYGLNADRLARMQDATRDVDFSPGTTLPGRVLRSGRVAWVRDMAEDSGIVRQATAKECGLRGAAAFPVWVDHHIAAVAEFFGPDVFEPDASQQALVEQVLLKVGVVIARQQAEAALLEAKAQLSAALTNMSQGLCMFDGSEKLLLCNSRFAALYGMDGSLERDVSLHSVLSAQAREVGGKADADAFVSRRLSVSLAGVTSYDIEAMRDGRIIAISHQPMAGGGWVETHDDITEYRRTQARLQHLAYHDGLTDLPNRLLFQDRLTQALAAARRNDETVALFCLDLDRFKDVNDSLGHRVGDELLQRVAMRLRRCVRDTDTVARLGGDEFAVVQIGQGQPSSATAFAQRMLAELALPYDLMGHRVVAEASVGIAIGPQDGTDADTLLRNADLAMYRAKANGRGMSCFFEASMHAVMQARMALETDLREAVSQDQFELYYQPIVDAGTRKVGGFEALIRWNHPQRGMISPTEFIPFAEEIGLINIVGAWVLRRACQDAASWSQPVTVAVNISPIQFRGDILSEVMNALQASGLPPQRLELEITESILLTDAESTLVTLKALKDIGIRIAMDDFGTGYSSLNYLRKFPFDRVKIDRSFVAELGEREDSAAIVRAVMDLCHTLGMATTAEGVETEAQLAEISFGHDISLQGFLFGRPQPARQVNHLLRALPATRQVIEA